MRRKLGSNCGALTHLTSRNGGPILLSQRRSRAWILEHLKPASADSASFRIQLLAASDIDIDGLAKISLQSHRPTGVYTAHKIVISLLDSPEPRFVESLDRAGSGPRLKCVASIRE